jgi:hypothetical protein
MGPVRYIEFITERYERLGYTPYRWYRADQAPPWTPMHKPLAESRVGVLSTAGAYVRGQVAFHYKDDTSLRAVPKATPVADIHFSHVTENYLPDARRDPNCVLPVEALARLEDEGVVGAIADELVSCMGAVYSQRRVRDELAPALAERFAAQAVDAVLLIPL